MATKKARKVGMERINKDRGLATLESWSGRPNWLKIFLTVQTARLGQEIRSYIYPKGQEADI